MATHLSGKISRLISDFWTISTLVDLIEHEMEKRIVARHGLVKIDSLLKLLPCYKNNLKADQSKCRLVIAKLELCIARLRNDYATSGLKIVRNAMIAHALQLDLRRISDTWLLLNKTVFSIISSDLRVIDNQLTLLDASYPRALIWHIDEILPEYWRAEGVLGNPNAPRMAIIYGGFATAGIVSPIPGGHPVQDAVIRVAGLMTFLNQIDRLSCDVSRGSDLDRLLSEIIVIDYCSLWDSLFTSGVRNDHGNSELSLLEQWRADGWEGVEHLYALSQQPHNDLQIWRDNVRNKVAAHMDPNVNIWDGDLCNWPMTREQLIKEAYRVLNAITNASKKEIRSQVFFMPPQHLKNSLGLAAQKGLHWDES